MICTQNGLKEFLSWIDEIVTGFILEEIKKREIGTEGIRRGISCYFERTSKKLRPALVYLSGCHFGAIQKEKHVALRAKILSLLFCHSEAKPKNPFP